MIPRQLETVIKSRIDGKKAIILLGPRQSGKTTLIETILAKKEKYLLVDCDDPVTREQLDNANTEKLKQIIGSNKIVFIDEAQRVKNIGLSLKIITDRIKNIQLFVSGSSSFDLSNEINEPLTGRKWEYTLYPISWNELQGHYGYLQSLQQLEQRIIFGMYPEVINNPGDEKEILKQLTGSYLYKDLLSYKGIRKPDLLDKLLRALALQTGSEVSYNEMANLLRADKATVSNYIQLLQKAFVIFPLQAFSRNLRNEIKTSRKIYFYDNGVRNAIISNFNPISLRQDTGALWENFLISERMKCLHYNQVSANIYFWRTKQQQEIDYIEERGGNIYAYEFKWGRIKKRKIPASFKQAYRPDFQNVNKENFQDFLTG
ncbi:MAG: ATP-binding protein [Bacteroidales bacterium]|nr:ATP-binding protein [Bacteroidales bacterium]